MWRALFLVLLLSPPAAAQAQEKVDLELVLMADSTGSIDAVENRMERQGYAAAMQDPQVLWAIRNGGERARIAVAYVEWAGARSQDVVVDWMTIADQADAALFAQRLLAAPRRVSGVNAIGAALLKGLDMLRSNDFDGARQVIDLSGDSIWNPRPPTIAMARDAALGQGAVINGLAILCHDCSGRPGPGNLEQDFIDQLITGPGAFVVTADSDEAFAEAVRRKLILEISALDPGTISRLALYPHPAAGPGAVD